MPGRAALECGLSGRCWRCELPLRGISTSILVVGELEDDVRTLAGVKGANWWQQVKMAKVRNASRSFLFSSTTARELRWWVTQFA